MNPLAESLNTVLRQANPYVLEMLSEIGRTLFFPKGILSQSAEAKEKAHRLNATIGIATEGGDIMTLPSVMSLIGAIPPQASVTYAPSFGLPALRQAWQAALYRKNASLEHKPISLPVVTCGVTHAISVFADMWLDPGDAVVLPDMMWGNYNMILGVRKGVRICHYPVFTADRQYNVAGFEKTVREAAERTGKVCALMNFPHNPSGYAISTTEGEQMAAALLNMAERGANVLAACDDSYFGLYYDDEALRESLFARLVGAHPRLMAVKLDGATKENFVWGLRVGFITYGGVFNGDARLFYDALERKSAGCVRGNISNASHLSQSVVLHSMENPGHEAEKQSKFEILKRRAARVCEVLEDPRYQDAFEAYPFNAGYFMCIRLKTVDAEALRVHLLERYGVGLISLGSENLRIAFSCIEEKDIPELFDTLLKGIKDLEGGI